MDVNNTVNGNLKAEDRFDVSWGDRVVDVAINHRRLIKELTNVIVIEEKKGEAIRIVRDETCLNVVVLRTEYIFEAGFELKDRTVIIGNEG